MRGRGDVTVAERPPLLSIVTICFNSAATIGDTFASVRRERDPRVEYVVIDGGSTDATPELMRANADLIDASLSEPDRGTSDALNKGARLARGTYLWFVNSDDTIEPGAVAVVLERLEAEDPATPLMLIGQTRYVSRDGTPLRMLTCDAAGLERILEYNPIPYPSTVQSRALFQRAGGFAADFEIVNDYEYFLRALALRPRVAFLDRVLAVMRDGGQSSSSASLSNRLRHQVELFRVQRRHRSFARACLGQVARFGNWVRGPAQ
ncbi:MAG: glycosyltransferase family 2 protein [Burkholderiales bacterium]